MKLIIGAAAAAIFAGAASPCLAAADERAANGRAANGAPQDFAAAPMPDPTDGAGPGADSPVVVELFLSQACVKCPPAAALLPDIAAREGVIALSWHVDYWNLTNSKNGQWADPFSHEVFTRRQKVYNAAIRNRHSVYTPQVVIGGSSETVGSSKEKINLLVNATAADFPTASVDASRDDEEMTFKIGPSELGGNAYLITFLPTARTKITSGANSGSVFNEVNVVTGYKPLGVVLKRGAAIKADLPPPGFSCALIVQAPKQRRVLAATYCPE